MEATTPGGRVPKGTPALGAPKPGPTRIAAHAVSRELLERVLRDLPVEAVVVGRPENAELVLTLRSRANSPRLRRASERAGARVLAIKRNSATEIRRALRTEFHLLEGVDPRDVHAAVADAEQGIQRVLVEGVSVPLTPRPSRLRKLQHTLVVRNHLEAISVGSEPLRHLVIYPLGTVAPESSGTGPSPEDVEPLEAEDLDAEGVLEDEDEAAPDEEDASDDEAPNEGT